MHVFTEELQLPDPEYPHFDADAYWKEREYKIWVVNLHHPAPRTPSDRRSKRHVVPTTRYIRAKTRTGAIKTALQTNWARKRITHISCRLATPTDLGAMHVST